MVTWFDSAIKHINYRNHHTGVAACSLSLSWPRAYGHGALGLVFPGFLAPSGVTARHLSAKNTCVATLRLRLQEESCLLSFKCLDPGSGRKIPAIWHGADAYPGVLSQKPSTDNDQVRVVVLRIAWGGGRHRDQVFRSYCGLWPQQASCTSK